MISPRHAFTLVELSIVLVIVGLLVGGILAGQSMIRAAELRAMTTEANRYATAATTFSDKYFGLPGDMKNATRYWGRQNLNADCVTNSGTGVSAAGTCDGDGDSVIETSAVNQSEEILQFWRQLALAGLIEGSYNGYATAYGVWDIAIGVNVPASRVPSSGWSVATLDNFGGNTDLFAVDFGNQLNAAKGSTNGNAWGPNLKPEEAWNIDKKVDDGKPATGKVIARYWNNLCSAADDGSSAMNDLAASYRVADNTLQCVIYFAKAF